MNKKIISIFCLLALASGTICAAEAPQAASENKNDLNEVDKKSFMGRFFYYISHPVTTIKETKTIIEKDPKQIVALIGVVAATVFAANFLYKYLTSKIGGIKAEKVSASLPVSGTALINELTWGSIKVEDKGEIIVYRDCKLFPAGSSQWDWKKTGTQHSPGIQIADLEKDIDSVDIIILSQGMRGVLEADPKTLTYLKKKGKVVHQLPTPAASKLYNELVGKGKKVGALIHTTC